MSPSLTSYSLSNLVSAKALPLRRRRWVSAGGPPGREARAVLIVAIVSAGCTFREDVHAGLVDLTVMLIAPLDANEANQKFADKRVWKDALAHL